MHRKILIVSLLCGFLVQSGCEKPSFPKAKVVSSVKKICADEYNLDVDVKVAGRTIGVCFEVENLINTKTGFDEKAVEYLGNILLSVSRVCLSTDADFEFYVVVAKDTSMPGIECLFIRHVYDVKRVPAWERIPQRFFQQAVNRLPVQFHIACAKRSKETFFRHVCRRYEESTFFIFKQEYAGFVSQLFQGCV